MYWLEACQHNANPWSGFPVWCRKLLFGEIGKDIGDCTLLLNMVLMLGGVHSLIEVIVAVMMLFWP